MIRRSLYRNIKYEINIVPMLDILLVLVLLFLITSTVNVHYIQVNLPNGINSKKAEYNNTFKVIIEVLDTGKYNLITDNQRYEQLHKNNIVSKVLSYISIRPKTLFLIGGSKNVPYNEIIKMINILRQVGIKTVGLMTYPMDF